MSNITKATVLNEFKTRVQDKQLARAVWHSGKLPPKTQSINTYNVNVFTSVASSANTLGAGSITSATISSSNVLGAFRTWAQHVATLRRVRTGLHYTRWGSSSSQNRYLNDRTDIAKVNTANRALNPTTVVNRQPGAGNSVSLSKLKEVLNNINSDIHTAVSNTAVLDLRACHSSCHSNCHGSRGRR